MKDSRIANTLAEWIGGMGLSQYTLLAALTLFFIGFGFVAISLDTVLAYTRPKDTLTLWHLVPRVPSNRRADVVELLARYSPPPVGVTAEGVIDLDPDMLETWWTAFPFGWSFEATWPAGSKGPK